MSPGGVGYDINCGVRLLASDLELGEIESRIEPLVDALFDAIPAGIGSTRREVIASEEELDALLAGGLEWAHGAGLATDHDIERVEEHGRIRGARPEAVGERARTRGRPQLGTLGSGNHFAEVGVVDEVFDETKAQAFGLAGRGQLAEGAWADIAVLDPAALREKTTFADPHQYAEGCRCTIVNGQIAFDGQESCRRPGQWLVGRVG